MQDLTLVGLTEDRKKIVLVSDSGEKFTLPADEKLRAALRGDLARLGQLEIQMESALRPRDIQARIRAGESPETVAQAAQTTVDRIMSYATPVLAERAHIAERAQRASIRRRAGEGPTRILGDTVAEQLRSRNIDPDSVEWDSWRRDDGRWALVASLRADDRPRRAEFVFDVRVADDVPLIHGHHEALARALSNVVLNAVEACKGSGGIAVDVRRMLWNGGAAVELSVSDTGHGIPPERLARIWEPYVTYKAGGTGLGLAIARQTVLAHGGEVSATSEPGKGTTIRFMLPATSP